MRSSLLLMAVAVAAVVVAVWTMRSGPSQAAADLILVGGEIYTVEADEPRAEGVAVRDGWIVAVGSESEVSSYRGPNTVVVDLEGAFVVPGFIDNHTHFDRAAQLLLGINLLDVADAAAEDSAVDQNDTVITPVPGDAAACSAQSIRRP